MDLGQTEPRGSGWKRSLDLELLSSWRRMLLVCLGLHAVEKVEAVGVGAAGMEQAVVFAKGEDFAGLTGARLPGVGVVVGIVGFNAIDA